MESSKTTKRKASAQAKRRAKKCKQGKKIEDGVPSSETIERNWVWDDALPPEIVTRVLSFVGIRSRLACSGVSRSWRSVAIDEAFWRTLDAPTPDSVLPHPYETWFERFCKTVVPRLCVECERRPGKQFPWTGERVCLECNQSGKRFRVIAKKTATTKYRLKESHLEDLECVETKNPHYRSAATMKLYLRADVRKLSLRVHGSKDARLAAVAASQERSARLRRTKEERKAKRSEALGTALAQHGLALRPDSALCKAYVEGKEKSHSVEQIVEIMHKHKVLYEDLDFGGRFERWLRGGGFQDCCDTETPVGEAREEFKERLWRLHLSGQALDGFEFSI